MLFNLLKCDSFSGVSYKYPAKQILDSARYNLMIINLVFFNFLEYEIMGLIFKGCFSGEQFANNAAEGPDIYWRPALLAGQYLRRQVLASAHKLVLLILHYRR